LADSKGGGNPSGTEVPNSQATRTARASIRLRTRNSQDPEELKTVAEELKIPLRSSSAMQQNRSPGITRGQDTYIAGYKISLSVISRE
jgi:hypothetical protein